jgi:hypothetical protein
MKYLMVLSLLVVGCGANGPQPTCQSGQLLGSDNQCYSCNYGTPEYAGSEFGYCGSMSAGGVACCSTTFGNFGGITCPASHPYLCDDGKCWNQWNGNGSLACVLI